MFREKQKMTDERFYELTCYERELRAKGYRLLAGVDEAGRGPLAGPVAAGCVIFPEDCELPRADDSKKLSAGRRNELFDEIRAKALGWGVGLADNEEIDRVNILQATYAAMRRAIAAAAERAGGRGPDILLVDHVHIPEVGTEQFSLTHGDALSVTIGAASILAKVTRDRIMEEYDSIYPGYGFAGHKGYGTAMHYKAIKELGLCPIHRRTFLKKILEEEQKNES